MKVVLVKIGGERTVVSQDDWLVTQRFIPRPGDCIVANTEKLGVTGRTFDYDQQEIRIYLGTL